MNGIAGARRSRPVDFSSRPYDSAGERQAAFHVQPHRDGGRVPATGYEPLEEAALGCLTVCMKRLRVELGRERLDLRLVDRVGAAGKALPHMKVIQMETICRDSIAHQFRSSGNQGAIIFFRATETFTS